MDLNTITQILQDLENEVEGKVLCQIAVTTHNGTWFRLQINYDKGGYDAESDTSLIVAYRKLANRIHAHKIEQKAAG